MMPSLLHQIADRAAERAGPQPAIYFGERVITFQELRARSIAVSRLAAQLVGPGQPLAMVGPNHPSWVECYYGVPRAGRTLLFLNHRLAAPELGSLIERSGATQLIGPAEELDRLAGLPRIAAGAVRTWPLEEWEAAVDSALETAPERVPRGPAAAEDLVTDPETPAWLLYTSGTTGRPKGAVLTHAGLLAAVRISDQVRPIDPDAVLLFPYPLCHIAGFNLLCHHLRQRPVVLMPRFEVADFLESARRYRVTHASMTATMVSAVLDEVARRPEARSALATLRGVAYGAAPMAPSLIRRLHEELGVQLTQGYGMTELGGLAVFLTPQDHDLAFAGAEHLLRSAGRPAPGVGVRVVDDQLRDVAVGQPGEIVVQSDQVMAGYWGDPESTRAALAGGWLRTGDLGTFDAEGWLYVLDRKKDVIVTGGENVASLEVEEAVLQSCPEVKQVAVVGVPDPHWGENVCAVVVTADGDPPDLALLQRRLRGRLAGFKLPRHVVAVPELPKNATGKVQKEVLRRWLADRPEVLGARR